MSISFRDSPCYSERYGFHVVCYIIICVSLIVGFISLFCICHIIKLCVKMHKDRKREVARHTHNIRASKISIEETNNINFADDEENNRILEVSGINETRTWQLFTFLLLKKPLIIMWNALIVAIKCILCKIYKIFMTRQDVSSMIHSARPIDLPVVNIVFTWNLLCFEKCGRKDVRTTCVKTIIITGRDCGSASWIKNIIMPCCTASLW